MCKFLGWFGLSPESVYVSSNGSDLKAVKGKFKIETNSFKKVEKR